MDTLEPTVLASSTNLQMACATGQSAASVAEEWGRDCEELTAMEQRELEAQLQVEAMCDVLQSLPKPDLWELLSNIGVAVPSQDSGERMTKIALVDAALNHLHAKMHHGCDMEDYKITIYSHVWELIDMGLVADPWAAAATDGEELSPMDSYNELVSYLPALSEVELRLALDQLCCICLLEAKSRPMSQAELAEEMICHLQHTTMENRDITVERDVLRRVYKYRGEDGDSDSDTDEAADSQGGCILPEDLRTTGTLVETQERSREDGQELTKGEMVTRIDKLAGKLFNLPHPVIVAIVDGVCPEWVVAELGDYEHNAKDAVILEIRDALREQAVIRQEAASTVADIEWAIEAYPGFERQRILHWKLKDRGRSFRESKKARRLAAGKRNAQPATVEEI